MSDQQQKKNEKKAKMTEGFLKTVDKVGHAVRKVGPYALAATTMAFLAAYADNKKNSNKA